MSPSSRCGSTHLPSTCAPCRPSVEDAEAPHRSFALGRRLGAPRINVQVGLTPAVAEAIDLKNSAGQLAILTATTRGVGHGPGQREQQGHRSTVGPPRWPDRGTGREVDRGH